MSQPNVVYISLTNGDEVLFVNGSQILLSEAGLYVHGIYETASNLAKALAVKLVEYKDTPVPDYDDWTTEEVLASLPDLPFTCSECGRVYDDSAVCTSLDCPSNQKPMINISDKRRVNVINFLMNSYQLTEDEAKEYAERGKYSYVLSGDLASIDYYDKKKAPLHPH